ncbi:MAG: thiamine phosphate synthase [Blastocatellia bacterium]
MPLPPFPLTCLITTGEATPENFDKSKRQIIRRIESAFAAGISIVQIREKLLSTKQLFELTVEATSLERPKSSKLLVNDRADIAFAAKADGVHLPESGMTVEKIRAAFPPEFIVGASVHSTERAVQARLTGGNFVLFGPVFDTPGKGPAKGLKSLLRVCEEMADFPVIGIGGVDRSNFHKVLECGAAGFAAIRFLNDLNVLEEIRNGSLSIQPAGKI